MPTHNIDAEILRQATECEYGFKCTSPGDEYPRCPVDKAAGPLLFVKATGSYSCAYLLGFADGCVCRCPSRKEIYTRCGL
jgi:hypothetical protein